MERLEMIFRTVLDVRKLVPSEDMHSRICKQVLSDHEILEELVTGRAD